MRWFCYFCKNNNLDWSIFNCSFHSLPTRNAFFVWINPINSPSKNKLIQDGIARIAEDKSTLHCPSFSQWEKGEGRRRRGLPFRLVSPSLYWSKKAYSYTGAWTDNDHSSSSMGYVSLHHERKKKSPRKSKLMHNKHKSIYWNSIWPPTRKELLTGIQIKSCT